MICSSVNLLFVMPVILLVDGLHYLCVGTAGRGQVTPAEPLQASHLHDQFARANLAAQASSQKSCAALPKACMCAVGDLRSHDYPISAQQKNSNQINNLNPEQSYKSRPPEFKLQRKEFELQRKPTTTAQTDMDGVPSPMQLIPSSLQSVARP